MLTGCTTAGGSSGSGNNGQSSSSEPLHFEVSGGVLDYDSYEYVSKGFYSNDSGDYSKTICLNFIYKNKENKQKNYSNDFRIKAYQNGTELKGPSSYSPSAMPESMNNARSTVLQGGELLIGCGFVLQDYSPVTIIANQNGGKAVSNQMILEIEEYTDNSFDIDKLYGYWEGKGDTALTITSSRITLNTSKTSTRYTDNPGLWTDETTLHTKLSDVEQLEIEEVDGVLHLSNNQYEFTQKENWSESSGSSGELQTINLGETISVDFAELYFDKKGISNSLEFSNTKGNGGGYGGNITFRVIIEQEKPGTKYIYLQGTIKNTSSREFDPENMKAKAVVNDTYELDVKVSAVDGGSSVSRLDPLNTATLVLDAAIDDKTAGEIKKIDWYFGFDPSFSGGSSGDPSTSRYYYLVTVQ